MSDRGMPPVYTSSIVTNSPTVCLCLSKYDFVHHIDATTQSLILGFSSLYSMDDRAIRASIAKTFQWEVDKKSAVHSVLVESAERRRLDSPRGEAKTKVSATGTPRSRQS